MKKTLTTSYFLFITLISSFAQEKYIDKKIHFENYIDNILQSNQNKSNKKLARTENTELSLTMDNSTITNDGSNDFLEFDILIKANEPGLFFNNVLINLDYSASDGNSVFGTNVAENGNIELTYGPLFQDLTTYEPNLFMDQDTQIVGLIGGIHFFPPTGVYNRVETPLVDTPLLHIKLKMTNCSQEASIGYNDDQFTLFDIFFSYTETSDANGFSDAIAFDERSFKDNMKLTEAPKITGKNSICSSDLSQNYTTSFTTTSLYEWSAPSNVIFSSSTDEVNIEFISDGDITVKALLGCGFSKTGSLSVSIKDTCSITNVNTYENDPKVSFYPNPANKHLTVQNNNKSQLNISILNRAGLILTEQDVINESRINIEHLPSGPYIIRIISNDVISYSQFNKL